MKRSSNNEAVARKGELIGDAYLPEDKNHFAFDDDIVMDGDGVLSTISFKTIIKCIGGNIETVIKKNEDSHEKKMVQQVARRDASDIKLEDLIFIKKLGFG